MKPDNTDKLNQRLDKTYEYLVKKIISLAEPIEASVLIQNFSGLRLARRGLRDRYYMLSLAGSMVYSANRQLVINMTLIGVNVPFFIESFQCVYQSSSVETQFDVDGFGDGNLMTTPINLDALGFRWRSDWEHTITMCSDDLIID